MSWRLLGCYHRGVVSGLWESFSGSGVFEANPGLVAVASSLFWCASRIAPRSPQTPYSRYSRGVANQSERSEAPVRGASLACQPNQSTPANALAYSPAKGTNLGKERSGNDCQSGYTPFAALSRTHPAIPVASSPLFPLRKSSSRGERLPRWSAS